MYGTKTWRGWASIPNVSCSGGEDTFGICARPVWGLNWQILLRRGASRLTTTSRHNQLNCPKEQTQLVLKPDHSKYQTDAERFLENLWERLGKVRAGTPPG